MQLGWEEEEEEEETWERERERERDRPLINNAVFLCGYFLKGTYYTTRVECDCHVTTRLVCMLTRSVYRSVQYSPLGRLV